MGRVGRLGSTGPPGRHPQAACLLGPGEWDRQWPQGVSPSLNCLTWKWLPGQRLSLPSLGARKQKLHQLLLELQLSQ